MRFVHDAGLLCLDLVNTNVVLHGAPVDLLTDYDALLDWLDEAGVLDASARGEADEWRSGPDGGEGWRAAVELRGAVRRIADDMIAGRPIADADIARVNRSLAARSAVGEIRRDGDGFRRVTLWTFPTPASLLAPVAESAAELVTALDPGRVGQCDDADCILYFYDTSKNHSRRWCSMERCGNRAKVARHYRRQG